MNTTTKQLLFICTIVCFIFIGNNSVLANSEATDDYCQVLELSLMFYKANRAGRLPDNDIPWRGNSVLLDSYNGLKNSAGDGILSGGYFDAGDSVKFAFPMSFSMTLLGWGYLEFEENVKSCGLSKLYVDTLKWGYDYLIASHISDSVFVGQVGKGGIDHSFWGAPENIPSNMERPTYTITTSAPGTDLAMEAASALAICSIIFKDLDSAYSQNCLNHAKSLYQFGMDYKGKYSDSITDAAEFYRSWSGYNDEMVWGSIWLNKATGNSTYLDTAKLLYSQNGIGNSHNFDWDDKAVGCQLQLFKLTGESTYKDNLENNLNYWLPGGGQTYTSGGLAWASEWGTLRYSMNMAFIAKVYSGQEKYPTFTKSQLDYSLGHNPQSQSFVVGYGPKYPINPHHRASHHSITNNIANPFNNTYILYGALVGGPLSISDNYQDDRTNYKTNEVALDYNAGFVGVLSSYAQGSVTTDSPTTTTPFTSISDEDHLNQSNTLILNLTLIFTFVVLLLSL